MIVYTVFLEDIDECVIHRILSPIRFEIGDKFELGVADVSQYTRDKAKVYLGEYADVLYINDVKYGVDYNIDGPDDAPGFVCGFIFLSKNKPEL